MCIDVDAQKIYLFGGWDGSRDLSDLWCFDIQRRKWDCLSMDTRKYNFYYFFIYIFFCKTKRSIPTFMS